MIILYYIIAILLIGIIIKKPKINIGRTIKIIITIAIGTILVRLGAAYAAPITTLLGFLIAYNQPIKRLLNKFFHINQTNNSSTNSSMTLEEAKQILGVSDNPTKEEIKEAYHKLMRKIHPDHGGSEYISKKVNEAKDILLDHY